MTRKTVTQAGQPRAKSVALGVVLSDLMCPYERKSQITTCLCLNFELQKANQPVSFQVKTLSYVFAISNPTEMVAAQNEVFSDSH